MKRITKLCVLVVITLLLCSVGSQAFADGIWYAKQVVPNGAAASGGAINGKLYVVGGWDGYSYAPQNATYVYNPLTNLWTTKATVPHARIFASSAVVNGKLYVIGGATASYYYNWSANSYITNGPSNIVDMYDPVTNTWVTKANMLTARWAPSVGVIDGKIYVAGGKGASSSATNTLEVYDPKTDTWSMLDASPMPTGVYEASYGVINGKLYVAGGYASDHISNAVEVYDPSVNGNGWTQETPMPNPRLQPASDVINGKLYVAGGWDGYIYRDDLEIYDAATGTWTTDSPHMPTWRAQAVGGAIDGKFYVAGGIMNNGVVLAENEVFIPAAVCP